MTNKYRVALAEVNAILKNAQPEVLNKIPTKFKSFILENMDTNYKDDLDMSRSIEEQDISELARKIIALIYRDYLCSKEKRMEFIKLEKNNKSAQYDSQKIFEK